MFEVLMLRFLAKRIAKLAEEHGRRPSSMKGLLFVCWIGLEIVAFVLAVIAGASTAGIYIAALTGAAIGCYVAFTVAGRGPVLPASARDPVAMRQFTQAEIDNAMKGIPSEQAARLRRWHLETDGSLTVFLGGSRPLALGGASVAVLLLVVHLIGAMRAAPPWPWIMIGLDLVAIAWLLHTARQLPATARLDDDSLHARVRSTAKVLPLASVEAIETSHNQTTNRVSVDLRSTNETWRFAFAHPMETVSLLAALIARRRDLEPVARAAPSRDKPVVDIVPTARVGRTLALVAWLVAALVTGLWWTSGSRQPEQPAIASTVLQGTIDRTLDLLPRNPPVDAAITVTERACKPQTALMRVEPPSSIISVQAKASEKTDLDAVDRWGIAVHQYLSARELGYRQRDGFSIGLPTSRQRWVEISTACVTGTNAERQQLIASFKSLTERMLAVPEGPATR